MTGAISMMMGGKPGGHVVSISSTTGDNTVVDPADATAGYRLLTTGQAQVKGASYSSLSDQWTSPITNGVGALYEARATVTSGALSSGTAGSWLPLSTDREWTRTRVVLGTVTCVFTLEIRDAATLIVLATATITLTATVEG